MKPHQKKLLLGLMIGIVGLFLIINLCGLASATSLGNFAKDNCVNLIQTCANCSYVNITSIMYPNSSIAISNVEMIKDGTYYYYNYCNTSLNGVYQVTGFGDLDGIVEVWNYDFIITPNGEQAEIGTGIFYIGILSILIIFLILSINVFAKSNNLLAKVGMFGLSYLLLIAIVFISWNMAIDFLTSSPFLIAMLRILFFVLMAGFFPLIIGSFAWYFIMLSKIKEIERLMEKGMDMNEAERRTGRKYK